MSRLWWTAVAVFLTAQSIDAVDVDETEDRVIQGRNQLLKAYKPSETRPDRDNVYPMVRLAWNIPDAAKPQDDLTAVFEEDGTGMERSVIIRSLV